jgi:beta-lactam-binding protein with PASTA domain
VVVDESKKLRVPALVGLPVRRVIEQAAAAGLEVRIVGSGTVREQLPAAGSMVAPGTQIVVGQHRPCQPAICLSPGARLRCLD